MNLENKGFKLGIMLFIVVIGFFTYLNNLGELDYTELLESAYYKYSVTVNNPEQPWLNERYYYMSYSSMLVYLLPIISISLLIFPMWNEMKDFSTFRSNKIKTILYGILIVGIIVLLTQVDNNKENHNFLRVDPMNIMNVIHISVNLLVTGYFLVRNIIRKNINMVVTMIINLIVALTAVLILNYYIYWFIVFIYIIVLILQVTLNIKETLVRGQYY